jgi:plastocyanin
MTRLLALLLACTALLAAGCGGGDDEDSGSSDQAPAPSAQGGGTEVSMKDIKFDPETVTVKPGDTVTWVNDDSVDHDVTADDFKSGEPGGMSGGATFKHKFTTAGTFDYVCSVHPGMEGSVVVK